MAGPVPEDDFSLLNGADYFSAHCTECHGWDPSEQFTGLYGDDPDDGPDPLLELLQPESTLEVEDFTVEEIDDWPEWAERPPEPEEDEDEALRSSILSDLTSAIDEVYEDDSDPWGYSEDGYDEYQTYEELVGDDDPSLDTTFGEDNLDEFDRMPGATDLTRPQLFIYGTSETDLFENIAYGTGPTMPGFLDALGSEEAVWDLVNYIRSLWPEEFID